MLVSHPYPRNHGYYTLFSVVGLSVPLFLYDVQVNFLSEREKPTFPSPQVLFDGQSRPHFFVMPSWRPTTANKWHHQMCNTKIYTGLNIFDILTEKVGTQIILSQILLMGV